MPLRKENHWAAYLEAICSKHRPSHACAEVGKCADSVEDGASYMLALCFTVTSHKVEGELVLM